ncbi:hypothetical protein Lal_00045130 [Lupinus albus]|nr:hypothetical protein Lal_00045130 [Lupinus albus]
MEYAPKAPNAGQDIYWAMLRNDLDAILPATETTNNKLSPQSGIPISGPGQQSFLYMETPVVNGLAAQVKPKLSDEESVSMFIDTLQTPFFDQMIGNVHSDFRQLIRIGERIENRFGSGKIKKSFANKIIQRQSRKRKRKSLYDPIPMSYAELLPQLFQRSLLTLISSKKVDPPYPQGFNPDASCEYHTGAIGHFIKDCDQLKSKVQYLINSRSIRF